MKIGPGVSELWAVENRPLPLTRPMAYTTACTTVQAVIYRVAQKSKPPPIFQKIALKIANEIRFLRKVKVRIKHYNTIR